MPQVQDILLLQYQKESISKTSFKKTVLGAVTKPLLYLVGWLAYK
jgi:hypothetical protein